MQKIRLMALGGLDEDGKNMYLVEIDGDIFIVDCGLKYPSESEQLGIEYIIPDFTYIKDHKERVKGLFISHAHDDVMSAIGHLLKEIDVEVYSTTLTSKLLNEELIKHGINKKHINVVKRNETINVAGHNIKTFPIMQSIADGVGFAFETEHGYIVYTSEFIFDYDILNKSFSMDVNALSQLGEKGVLCLLSESTGSTREGYTAPKHNCRYLVWLNPIQQGTVLNNHDKVQHHEHDSESLLVA